MHIAVPSGLLLPRRGFVSIALRRSIAVLHDGLVDSDEGDGRVLQRGSCGDRQLRKRIVDYDDAAAVSARRILPRGRC